MTVTERLAVFGSGNWALALADQAARSDSRIMMYVRRPELRIYLQQHRSHPDYLTHLRLPPRVSFTSDLQEAACFADAWLLVVPSQFMRAMAEKLQPWIGRARFVISASKGLEIASALRMTQVLHDVWQQETVHFGALSGPNLADEISRGQPAASVLAGSPELFAAVANILGQGNMRLYGHADVTGVELGGALKNILAIAVGIAASAGLGENAQAAIMTRGLHEMGRLAVRLGAQWETLAGLSGLGDVVATASSPHSRNRWLGTELGQGRVLDDILSSTPMVVEGVPTSYVARRLGYDFALPMPITTEVVEIFKGKPVKSAIDALMSRERVQERKL